MSYSLVVNIWLSTKSSTSAEMNAAIRSFIGAGRGNVNFLRAEAFTRPNKSLALIDPVAESGLAISRFIEDHWDEEHATVVEAGFPLFEEDAIVSLPCSVRFFGKNYGHYHQKRFGDIEIAFENVASFAGLRDARVPARFGRAKNFGLVLDLVKSLTVSLGVEHSMVSTSDTEANPLCAHAMFHRQTEDFLNDLKSIATLHAKGGIYRSEVYGGYSPLSITKGYGHLRRAKGDQYLEEFLKRVDRIAEYFARDNATFQMSDAEIERTISSVAGIIVDSRPEGTIVSTEYGPLSYIDEVYWSLFSALFKRSPEDKRQSP